MMSESKWREGDENVSDDSVVSVWKAAEIAIGELRS